MNFNFKCKILEDEKNKSFKDNLIDYLKGFLMEFVGTLLLAYFGCACFGAIISDTLGIALCYGLTYGSILQVFYLIDLAQINPAITLSYYIFGMFSLPMMFVYMIAQLLGAVFGTFILKEMSTKNILVTVNSTCCSKFGCNCCTKLKRGVSTTRGFLWEFGLTCFLILFVCSFIESRNVGKLDSMPFKFGLLLIFPLTFVGLVYTGGSMNPARTFGPAVVANEWDDHWIYWAAPFLASVITSFGYHIFLLPKDGQEPLKAIIKDSNSKSGEGNAK